MRKETLLLALSMLLIGIACKKDKEEEPTPPSNTSNAVVFELDEVPYDNLSDYRFFLDELSDMRPNDRVIYYDPISHLFTDYAKKNRYIWMPEGSSASYVDDHLLYDYPLGTTLIKTFYYDRVLPSDSRKILETRLMIKKEEGWIFAEYRWNEEQTEASLIDQGENVPLEFIDEHGTQRSITYRVPSVVGGECHTCHKKVNESIPIGPKPQNLNKMMDYSHGMQNQIEHWRTKGILDAGGPSSEDIYTVVNWEDASADLDLRVRSYIDINCAHCHREGSHCDYRPMRFAWNETVEEENLGVCVTPDEALEGHPELIHIVSKGIPARSMLLHRMSSVNEAVRMPLLGRSIVHEEAIEMMTEWINSFNENCP